ncbi:hypothetical protein [Paractinoplanes lichenicola]|uniref:DUF7919 domain-containing protein n=1 Tax=Paractinoplanes lichenicola TaxID=2802976 RepID=A0ABS1VWD2_9ACTN|nr:hypothetical protein [Actinoplanes lichenicola]MBL7258799.1 hypothetical protein [Actinoplanes lichenicola]
MTHFEELSPYSYGELESLRIADEWIEYRPRHERINVGWLDAPHEFATGTTPDWFADALLDVIAGIQVNATRVSSRRHAYCCSCGRRRASGHAEIRVPDGDGKMFAAPTLVWPYVTAHRYRPPDEFVEAVRAYDPAWAGSWIPEDAERS